MPLLDRQAKGVVLGAIRIGHRVVTAKGKVVPAKLSTFRLTSPDRLKIEYAAQAYGGEVRPWQPSANAAGQWEVVTRTDRLPVRIPPGSPVVQDYELWTGTRQRLCDGRTERLKTGGPCLCPPDLMERKRLAAEGGACKPVTRLAVILADLPGLGVWSLASTGDSAADELGRVAELLHELALAGRMLPATLRLEQRESRGSGEVHHFAVPVLDVDTTLVALESGQVPELPRAVAAAPRLTAIEGPVEPPPIDPPAEPVGPPVGAPGSAQHVADLALEARDDAELTSLCRVAVERGWMEEYVRDGQGVLEQLGMMLVARRQEVGR